MSGRLTVVLATFALLFLAACAAGPTGHTPTGHTPTGHAPSSGPHTPVPAPTAPPTARPAALVEFVGASVTAGWYSSGVLHAYPQDVIDALRAGGEDVVPAVHAIPGATVSDALTWDIQQRANVVVVQMGSNNFAANTPLSIFEPLYQQLITTLRAASPKADLVCLGQWHRSYIYDTQGDTPEDFDAIMSKICEAAGGAFEPLEDVYDVAANHGPLGTPTPFGRADLLHPNDTGDQAIANVVIRGLQQQPSLSQTS